MASIRELMEEHHEVLRRGEIPAAGPPVLVEAARPDEKLLPKPEQLKGPARWSTLVLEDGLAQAQDARIEQLRALQDLISDDSEVFPVVKDDRNESPNICIGRAPRNDIVFVDQTISSLHAYIEDLGARHCLHDHRSSNGTFVNRERVGRSEVTLRSGDCVRFGDRVFYYLTGDKLSLFLGLRLSGRVATP